jgi:hypothetical protein
MNIFNIYQQIFFSFIYRDNEFPAVQKIKGFSIKGFIKSMIDKLKVVKYDKSLSENSDLKGKIWLYVESINQYRALSEIIGLLDNAVLVSRSRELINTFSKENEILYLNLINSGNKMSFWQYKRLFKNRFFVHISTIIKNYGVYEALVSTLDVYKPKAVVMSNDHNAFCRALLFASKEKHIPSIYLQHAAVTNRFPPLSFDLNLLEGQDSLNKYKEAGPIEGQVELVGMLKFDKYYGKINQNKSVKTIGIALNGGDNFEDYFTLTDEINSKFNNISFIYRFHPAIDLSAIAIPEYVKISKVTEENPFEFLSRIDMLFAGNSSIHLEAAMMNVVSYVVEFQKIDLIDYYGFIKNGLIETVDVNKVIQLVAEILNNRPELFCYMQFWLLLWVL